MLPTYELAVNGQSKKLHAALKCAWDFILTPERTVADCQKQLNITMGIIQSEPKEAGALKLYAEDPIAAVAYALRAIISENPEEPTWAAQRMFETVGRYIEAKERFPLSGPELVMEIAKQPLMQAEFSRQFEDLDELHDWSLETGMRVKARAEANPALPNRLL